ncbi:hypothetical protein K501DRAFT_269673 [Backusella circina FSU 941]|nr:hypothetical protein K501DRAFT_269673 [Backusella circina FSU 941]
MNRLSNEILTLIFKYLHREQKVQCMLVSRLWNRVLGTGLDIETIEMSSWPSRQWFDHRLESLTRRILTNSSSGLRCKRLIIDGSLYKELDKATLAKLFPNLNFLFLSHERSVLSTNQSSLVTTAQVDQLQCWRENLITLIEESYTCSFLGFLKSGTFSRLKTLALSPSRVHFYRPFIVLCKALKNTPTLEMLSVKGVHTDVTDLEELHNNVPSLTALILLDSPLRCNHGIPVNIKPAERMKTLKMIDSPILFNFSLNAFEYIISKYPHMQEFVFTVDEFYSGILKDDDGHLEAAFNHLIRRIGSSINTIQLKLPFKTPLVLDLIVQRSIHLKYISVNTFGAMKTINKIVSSDCFLHLHTLSLFQVSSLKFNKFKKLPKLKALILEFKKKRSGSIPIELNNIIHQLPEGLEALELENVEIIVNPEEDWPNSSIRCLKLKNAQIAKELSSYLGRHFQKLDKLSLHYCHLEPSFELPDHSLSFVDINILQTPKFKYLGLDSIKDDRRLFTHLLLTVGDKVSQYLHQREKRPGRTSLYNTVHHDLHDHSLSHTCTSSPIDPGLTYFHFKCASVHSFYYNGYLVI